MRKWRLFLFLLGRSVFDSNISVMLILKLDFYLFSRQRNTLNLDTRIVVAPLFIAGGKGISLCFVVPVKVKPE